MFTGQRTEELEVKRPGMVVLLIVLGSSSQAEEMSDAERRTHAEWSSRRAASEEARLAPLRARAALKDWYAAHPEITPSTSGPMASLDLGAALSYVREAEESCVRQAEQRAKFVSGAFEMRRVHLAAFEKCLTEKLPATSELLQSSR